MSRGYSLLMASKNELAVPTFLKQWRTFRQLTQEDLAGMAGMTPPSISQIENGGQGFTDKSLARLAAALRCSPADLLVHDPTRTDSFWPLCQAAEKLTGRDRRRVHGILTAAIDPGRAEAK